MKKGSRLQKAASKGSTPGFGDMTGASDFGSATGGTIGSGLQGGVAGNPSGESRGASGVADHRPIARPRNAPEHPRLMKGPKTVSESRRARGTTRGGPAGSRRQPVGTKRGIK